MKATKTALCVLLASAPLLQACAPILIGGAAISGAFIATDRRTSGSQLEDQQIAMRASSRIRQQMPERNHIDTLSYNRRLLLTGEVVSEADKAQAAQIAAGVDNVVQVYNELAVMPNSSFSDRTADTMVTTRVKSALVDAKDLYANSVAITTERGIVYLMGRVTEREAGRITDLASTTQGVRKVVTLFEIITPEDLQRTLPQKPPTAQVRYTPSPYTYNANQPLPSSVPENAPVVRPVQAPAPVENR